MPLTFGRSNEKLGGYELLVSCLMLHAMCVWIYGCIYGVSMCYVYLWPVYLLSTSSGSAATRIYEYMYLFISSGRKCQLANYRFCMYCIIAYVCILRLLTTNVGIFPRKGKIDWFFGDGASIKKIILEIPQFHISYSDNELKIDRRFKKWWKYYNL